MPRANLPDLAIVLTFLRSGQWWSQADLAKTANVSATLLNDYEAGRKPLNRERLEYLVSWMSLGPQEIDATLQQLEANRAAARARAVGAGRLSTSQRRVEEVAAYTARLAQEFARAVMSRLTFEAEASQGREDAKRLWARLERRKADERIALVEESKDFRTPALCELVAAKSIEAAPCSPSEALELARLALRIAELCPGDQPLRQRAQGYAWFHVANARRVTNDLPGSDAALTTATSLWKAGAPSDPGFFDEAIVLGLEATLQKSQRRFSEALNRVEEALAADRGNLRGKLLLSKAQILGAIGDIEASTEVLRQAILHIDPEREPRIALGVHCESLFNLCFQGRAPEAATSLRQAHALAEQLGQEVDLVRVTFLGGMIAAGIGRAEEAEEAFEEARRKFASYKPPLVFDYALVSLDLGLLLLEQNRTSEVRTLAQQMMSIFRSQGVHREALAALQIFCDAAEREAATVELTRRVIRFLRRSQLDPDLRFELTEEAKTP